MSINLLKRDNKQCYELNIGPHWLGISYTTIVAYTGPLGRFRTSANHSRTTERHLRLFSANYERIPQSELEDLCDKAIMLYGIQMLNRRMGASYDAAMTVYIPENAQKILEPQT